MSAWCFAVIAGARRLAFARLLAALALTTAATFAVATEAADAHRDGCHRWHSCPSDTGSYVCGDLGYTSECPGSTSPPPAIRDRDCGEFSTQEEAQAFFVSAGGPELDPHGLDADADGVACESLPHRQPPPPQPQAIAARITAVVDGETVKVERTDGSGRRYTVRLIGIDTPETQRPGVTVECGGPQATQSMKGLAFNGSQGRLVTLTTDPSQPTWDRYGRLLAYARTHAAVDLARAQLRRGWAKVYVVGAQFRRFNEFRNLASTARGQGVGVWGRCAGYFHRTDLDCSDFSSQSQAQSVYRRNGGPQRDPYRLDPNRNGIACEAA